ncbi:hypothetical protein [Pseudomonas soli]|uniref:Uncharacterized protein n=1 Tax=Pseudomonas soli TaxID=1306993 RepID=A0A1H9PZX6_9PSED|nr:hypothetical protein [Pseudomonas soli]SER53698.1 hypothetical protein SAMN05216230_10958 [Pseudomonas soli]
MTKPTVKGGLAPANAVVCEGKWVVVLKAGAYPALPHSLWLPPFGLAVR